MGEELLRCPFCNGKAVLINDTHEPEHIMCDECGVMTAPELWNLRAARQDAVPPADRVSEREAERIWGFCERVAREYCGSYGYQQEPMKLARIIYDAMPEAPHVAARLLRGDGCGQCHKCLEGKMVDLGGRGGEVMGNAVRCKTCGHRIPPLPHVRVCALCKKPIGGSDKYKLIQVKKSPAQYEFHHRNCKDTESYT